MEEKPVLYFDANCSFCEQMAAFTEKRFRGSLETCGWERHDSIGLKIGGKLHTDVSAWQKLLELDPHLSSLNWMAERLGLQKFAARNIMLLSRVWRQVCRGCGRR